MQKLNLPEYNFQFRKRSTLVEIFDVVRKKYVKLTPEEWVRQNFILYLNREKNVPLSLMAVEISKQVFNLDKRPDIVVYNNEAIPLMLVECKAPEVKVSQQVFDQAVTYNIELKVPYVIITNGLQHYCCKINYETLTSSFLEEIPNYDTLI